jgi:hypothetical protein
MAHSPSGLFIVGAVTRTIKPGTEQEPEWLTHWPVLFESTAGWCTDAVTKRDSRADAQIVADRLNKAL